MHNKRYDYKKVYKKIGLLIALVLVFVTFAVLVLGASKAVVRAEEEETYKASYTNPDTGYEAVIEDDAELIEESDYEALIDLMKQITPYGNVMLKTIDTNSISTEGYVRSLYNSRYGSGSGTIFIIDMHNRNIWIHSNGAIYSTVTSSYADTITDNVYKYASSRNYYMCAYKVFEQELTLLKGRRISQPMKYISNALLAVVAALLINYAIVRFYIRKKTPSRKVVMKGIFVNKVFDNCKVNFTYQSKTYSPVDTDSGSSSSGGGGSSGGSSVGSSGGGGGGGGHSF